MRESDQHWENFGKVDPYWAVITADDFHIQHFGESERERFFHSGEVFIEHIFSKVKTHIRPDFTPEIGLDFGSGVGRLTIPLSRRCRRVYGVEIADSMIQIANENARLMNADNIKFVKSDDTLSNIPESVDFALSFIVLQHLHPIRAAHVFEQLQKKLKPGGVGALHVLFSKKFLVYPHRPIRRQVNEWIAKTRVALGRTISKPQPLMEMNPLDLNAVFDSLIRAGVKNLYCELTDHGGEFGTIIYFEKPQ